MRSRRLCARRTTERSFGSTPSDSVASSGSRRRPWSSSSSTRKLGLASESGADLIAIKVGLHAGECLAVTLNDRLDYFGQTVNIAARVQGMAGPDEILVTDDVLVVQARSPSWATSRPRRATSSSRASPG